MTEGDRVGLGWRDALSANIFAHLDDIHVVEILAEDCFNSSPRGLRALSRLGCEVPLVIHGVTLGLASVTPVASWRLERLARLLGALEPVMWSEHLAFVRAGGYEIGHLAAPPRNFATIEGAVRNLERVKAVAGMAPALENVATLVDPPDSTIGEPEWVTQIAHSASSALLLDLHNLYANAVNFGQEPGAYLRRFPLERVRLVHLSGGHWISQRMDEHHGIERRLLDDHLHDVPDIVYSMLAELGEHCPQPLTVILERDGRYPEFSVLLDQLQRARVALAQGRRRAKAVGQANELSPV